MIHMNPGIKQQRAKYPFKKNNPYTSVQAFIVQLLNLARL